jgi:hypothetical protein
MDLKTIYNYKSNEIERKLSTIRKVVRNHNQVYDKNSQKIGFLGDLINLENRLDEVLDFTNSTI